MFFFFFFQAEDGIRDYKVTGVQTCALPIYIVEASVLHLKCAELRHVLVLLAFANKPPAHVAQVHLPDRLHVELLLAAQMLVETPLEIGMRQDQDIEVHGGAIFLSESSPDPVDFSKPADPLDLLDLFWTKRAC